jgi:hypothetical protein
MDIELLIKSIVGLIVILTILIVVFILPAKSKKKKQQVKSKQTTFSKQVNKKEKVLSFDELRAIVRKKSSTTKDLEYAVDEIVKHYSKIHPKMGVRTHPDFDKYIDLIVHLVRHKNTNKDLILKLDRALTKNNPDYKAELNDTLTKALNSRGI